MPSQLLDQLPKLVEGCFSLAGIGSGEGLLKRVCYIATRWRFFIVVATFVGLG